MDVFIQGRNLNVTTRLEDYVEKKTARLDRYMPSLSEVHVDLSEQKAKSSDDRQVAQITVRSKHGMILRAEERNSDIFAAVDAVVDKLYRQIKRYRGKQRRNRRNAHTNDEFIAAEPLPLPEEEFEETEDTQIVRRKAFALKPMTPEEAIDQMDLLGHDFFVFFNADEEIINVVYQRRDNTYGLLQPELS